MNIYTSFLCQENKPIFVTMDFFHYMETSLVKIHALEKFSYHDIYTKISTMLC
jgi:hypothetical protein